ncbi:TIGR04282 family arsenosugar biosynthesis glycosyltransferase [bacterium]|nr:TIGR04282 family arsenosugar biosynthesis glycosyltransferase [bacterium]
MSNRPAIALFAKAPVEGRVKTRLAAGIGDAAACRIYRELGRRVYGELAALFGAELIVFAPEGDDAAALRGWLGDDIRIKTQRGADLGARMENATTLLFDGGAACVLIVGCDGPEFRAAHAREAIAALATHDAVFAPTHDGGYILAGLSRPRPQLFSGLAWGGADVLADTLRIAEREGITVRLLETQRDLDVAADLEHFPDLRAMAHGDTPAP